MKPVSQKDLSAISQRGAFALSQVRLGVYINALRDPDESLREYWTKCILNFNLGGPRGTNQG